MADGRFQSPRGELKHWADFATPYEQSILQEHDEAEEAVRLWRRKVEMEIKALMGGLEMYRYETRLIKARCKRRRDRENPDSYIHKRCYGPRGKSDESE